MKIGNPDNKGGSLGAVGERSASGVDAKKNTTRGAAPAAGSAASTEPSAKVELSTAAASLNASGSEFDADKVDRIAAAIREGRYHVNAEAIADKLIANAQELLVRTPRA